MNKAYGVLSGHYEELAASDGYREWAEYVLKEVGENAKGKTGCDAACGSGYFTRALKRAGYSVEGADKSEDMLKVAQSKSVSEGLSINYYLCDLKNFRSFSKLDFITVINDGVNYLSAQDIPKAFAAFHRALKKGGFLFFDISSEYKLEKVIGNNLFAEDLDDLTYLWFNSFSGDKVKMELSFFEREGEIYRRRDETHVQYVHTRGFIEDQLENAGFSVVKECGHLGSELTEKSERIVFSAIKK